jgi:transcriptional regulator with XRE-family HTH domain
VTRKTGLRPAKRSNSAFPIDPENGSAKRRFRSSPESVTSGGAVFGALVANERAKLGLSQRELAARIHTSPSTVERIEQGHPPSAEIMERLSVALSVELPGPLRRSVARISPRVPQSVRTALRVPRSSLALGSRIFWPILAALAVTTIALIAVSLSTSSGTQASRLQPAVAVSNALGAPASIHRSRVQARKDAAAEARRAAERKREREAAAAAAAARKAAAKATSKSVPAVSPPVTAPATPSPAPSGGGSGSGGGGSSSPAPDLQHGIGGQGG